MKISENGILSNPIGWAIKVVGSKTRYYYFQFLTLLLGVASTASYYNSASRMLSSSHQLYRVAFFIFFSSCLLPLCYLRAMRALYLKGIEK